MKERLINVLKWLLMLFGALFIIQLLLLTGFVAGLVGFSHNPFNFNNNDKKLKQIQPIINYAMDYREKNGKYPEVIQNVKIKNDLYYKYEVSKDFNCFTITTKSKNNNLTKQYQHCAVQSDNSNSSSESYIEFTN